MSVTAGIQDEMLGAPGCAAIGLLVLFETPRFTTLGTSSLQKYPLSPLEKLKILVLVAILAWKLLAQLRRGL